MGERTIYRTYDLTGGINSQAKPWLIKDSESQDLRNFDLESTGKDGSLIQREGFTKYNSTIIASSTGVHSVYRYTRKTGTTNFLCSSATRIFKGNTAGTAFDATPIVGGLTTNKKIKYITFNNNLYYCNEADTYRKWDGVTASAVGGSSPDGAYYHALYWNRAWLARTATYPSRLYYSRLKNAEDWTANTSDTSLSGGYVDINPDDGDYITGIVAQQSRLIIFKRFAVYALYGYKPDNFQWQLLYDNTGCIAPYSIAVDEDTIFYLSNQGLRLLRGDTPPIDASLKIQSYVDAISDKTTCVGGVNGKGQYWLTIASNRVLLLNYRRGSWVDYRGITANVFYYDETNDDFYCGSPTAGYVFKLDTGTTDNGATIQTLYKSKAWGNPLERTKRFDKVYSQSARGTGMDYNIATAVNQVSASSKTVSASKTGANVIIDKYNFQQGIMANMIELTYSANSCGTRFNLDGYSVYSEVLKDD